MKTYKWTLGTAACAVSGLALIIGSQGSGAIAQSSDEQPAQALSLTTEVVPLTNEVIAPVAVEDPATADTAANDSAAQDVTFVSNPVVQEVPEPSEADLAPVEPAAPSASSLRDLVSKMPRGVSLSREMECLAGAVYFESRGEPLAGQLAVAKVVINRSESSRFPASYCGVVYQRAQFSFVRSGKMPRIARGSNAWHRASAIARIAHQDLWESSARDSLYFHANYVRPSWSRSKTRRATIKTHIFYR